MTTLKATCHTCGQVALDPAEVELRVFPVNRGHDFYSFICPRCGVVVRKYLAECCSRPDKVIKLLRLGGVEPTLPTLHDTDTERLSQLPPVGRDELGEFRDFLNKESYLAVFAGV